MEKLQQLEEFVMKWFERKPRVIPEDPAFKMVQELRTVKRTRVQSDYVTSWEDNRG